MTDVTDELVAKLHARREHGKQKYGGTLLPFDGRNTEYDIEEELLDALVYVTKMRMERAVVEKLIMKTAYFISWMEDHYQEIIDEFAGDDINSSPLFEMGRLLRADVPRIGVPANRILSGGPMARLEDMEKS